ncbi:MAG: glycosyltransferase family 4 protein [Nitrospiraceae bacterium]
MRLGVDGRELATGFHTGIGRYVIEVLRAASQEGWHCTVYGDRSTSLGVTLPGVTLRILDRRWTQWWDQVTLPRQLAQDRISVFLSPYYKGPLLAPCPAVLTIHDLFFITYLGRRRLFYDGVMTRVARWYATRATAIIADSEYSKRSIVTKLGISSEKITVIPVPLGNEFHEAPLTDELKLRYGITDPYILYVGNFWPHKNLSRLLQAFAGLGESLRNTYQLVLAGYDQHHQPALNELASTLGLTSRLLFPGPIANPDLPAFYSGCALFVLPSLEEGFGLPALEAMACGAPVIAANRAAIPEVVGKAAILFDPEDVAAITKAMADVLTQPELGTTLRRQGLMRSREFSPNRTAGRVLKLLQEVSEGRHQTRRNS